MLHNFNNVFDTSVKNIYFINNSLENAINTYKATGGKSTF